MDERGVSRPMPDDDGGEDDNGGEGGGPYSETRRERLERHHHRTLWCRWTVILLGLWTITAPLTFGYGLDPAPLDREVWLGTQGRIWAMTASDLVSGLLLVVFGWRSLTPNRPVSEWLCCGVGIWMSAAPVLFWAPSAAAYLNGTIVGALVIALTILIPGMPNMIMYMKMGGARPPGWSYNPSSWPQRGIMILLGFVGWLVSRYLAAYQLGYIDYVWDPFFGEASERVLGSEMSHMWPVSDGALGAFSYTFEFLMGWMGAPSRWRTMPWMVTFFGILVIPLGLAHILLVVSQPVVVGSWCTMCLLAAGIMLPMIPLEVDEVIAMAQHVRRRVDAGEPFWRVFWKGGDGKAADPDKRSPAVSEFPNRPGRVTRSSLWGMSWSWWLASCAAIGIGLMFSPTQFGYTGSPTADFHHLGGAMIVTTSVICMGEPLRRGRHLNLLWAVCIGISPWLFAGGGFPVELMATVAALAVVTLTLPRGPRHESYGRWDQYIR